jgi:hypothetical protein
VVWLGVREWHAHQAAPVAERRGNAEIAAPDQQHAWVMTGDDRGVYGPHGAQLVHYF